MSLSWSLVPLFHALAFALAVLARLILAARRPGARPPAFGTADSARDFTARCFYVWVPLLDFAFVGLYAWAGTPGPALWAGWTLAGPLRWAGAARGRVPGLLRTRAALAVRRRSDHSE